MDIMSRFQHLDDSDLPDPENHPQYTAPLQHKRAFGSTLKRKRIDFVAESAAADEGAVQGGCRPQAGRGKVGERYLSVVMGQRNSTQEIVEKDMHESALDERAGASDLQVDRTGGNVGRPTTVEEVHSERTLAQEGRMKYEGAVEADTCTVCRLPLRPTSSPTDHHATTLAHQLCLPHVYPPSHLDRSRKGLAYLTTHGWDPDARTGLGATGSEGRLYPIKTRMRDGAAGVGAEEVVRRERERERVERERDKVVVGEGRGTRGERKRAKGERRGREERCRMLVFGREEVNGILGVSL